MGGRSLYSKSQPLLVLVITSWSCITMSLTSWLQCFGSTGIHQQAGLLISSVLVLLAGVAGVADSKSRGRRRVLMGVIIRCDLGGTVIRLLCPGLRFIIGFLLAAAITPWPPGLRFVIGFLLATAITR